MGVEDVGEVGLCFMGSTSTKSRVHLARPRPPNQEAEHVGKTEVSNAF